MRVSPLRQTMKPFGSGRDEKVWVAMKPFGSGRDEKIWVAMKPLRSVEMKNHSL